MLCLAPYFVTIALSWCVIFQLGFIVIHAAIVNLFEGVFIGNLDVINRAPVKVITALI